MLYLKHNSLYFSKGVGQKMLSFLFGKRNNGYNPYNPYEQRRGNSKIRSTAKFAIISVLVVILCVPELRHSFWDVIKSTAQDIDTDRMPSPITYILEGRNKSATTLAQKTKQHITKHKSDISSWENLSDMVRKNMSDIITEIPSVFKEIFSTLETKAGSQRRDSIFEPNDHQSHRR